MSTDNNNLDQQIAACNSQTAIAQQAINDHETKINAQLNIISNATQQKNIYNSLNYGVQIANMQSTFTGCTTPENKNASTTGCAVAFQTGDSSGQNIFNNGGYYGRKALQPLAACGSAHGSCVYSGFGNDCNTQINQGCVTSAKTTGVYDPNLTSTDFTHFDKPDGSSGCATAIAYCQKTQTTLNREKQQLASLDSVIATANQTIANLGADTIDLSCNICSQVNSIQCGSGSVCSGNQQLSTCMQTVQQIEAANNACKASGGTFNVKDHSCTGKVTNTPNIPNNISSHKSKNLKAIYIVIIILILVVIIIYFILQLLK